MAVTVIPFAMPEPMEIPEHIVQALQQMQPDDAVRRGMELLLEIDAAEIIVYERVDGNGALQMGGVATRNGEEGELEARLADQDFYGKALEDSGNSLAGNAFGQQSSLLIMGQAEAGDEVPLPSGLAQLLLDGKGSGNVGFMYVLTMASDDGSPLGALTLVRPQDSGPLNHEQPNITEGLRRVLCGILSS